MSSTSETPRPHEPPATGPAAATTATRGGLPWWGFGIANIAIVFVVSVLLWWLLIDPQASAVGAYPQPFEAVLFWAIIAAVWIGFNCGWAGPTSMRQPARGLVAIVLTLVIAAVVTVFLAFVWGHFDPSFAASRAGGNGFTTGQLIVLFAFFFYVTAAINWNHWPWAGRLEQPWLGLAEIATLVLPTLVVYSVLALPGVATWAAPSAALISTNTLIGWFYSLIVSVIVTGLIWDNLPWRLARTPARIAWFSIIGNIVLGTALYYALSGLARLLMGPTNVAALGAAVTSHAAELGVCWVFWLIAWSNVFGNKPTHLAEAANAAIRTVITLVLGTATYLIYYFVLAPAVLHEPAAGASLHGEALGYMDWAVLVTLFYVVFLGSAGLPAPEPETAEANAETVAHETHAEAAEAG